MPFTTKRHDVFIKHPVKSLFSPSKSNDALTDADIIEIAKWGMLFYRIAGSHGRYLVETEVDGVNNFHFNNNDSDNTNDLTHEMKNSLKRRIFPLFSGYPSWYDGHDAIKAMAWVEKTLSVVDGNIRRIKALASYAFKGEGEELTAAEKEDKAKKLEMLERIHNIIRTERDVIMSELERLNFRNCYGYGMDENEKDTNIAINAKRAMYYQMALEALYHKQKLGSMGCQKHEDVSMDHIRIAADSFAFSIGMMSLLTKKDLGFPSLMAFFNYTADKDYGETQKIKTAADLTSTGISTKARLSESVDRIAQACGGDGNPLLHELCDLELAVGNKTSLGWDIYRGVGMPVHGINPKNIQRSIDDYLSTPDSDSMSTYQLNGKFFANLSKIYAEYLMKNPDSLTDADRDMLNAHNSWWLAASKKILDSGLLNKLFLHNHAMALDYGFDSKNVRSNTKEVVDEIQKFVFKKHWEIVVYGMSMIKGIAQDYLDFYNEQKWEFEVLLASNHGVGQKTYSPSANKAFAMYMANSSNARKSIKENLLSLYSGGSDKEAMEVFQTATDLSPAVGFIKNGTATEDVYDAIQKASMTTSEILDEISMLAMPDEEGMSRVNCFWDFYTNSDLMKEDKEMDFDMSKIADFHRIAASQMKKAIVEEMQKLQSDVIDMLKAEDKNRKSNPRGVSYVSYAAAEKNDGGNNKSTGWMQKMKDSVAEAKKLLNAPNSQQHQSSGIVLRHLDMSRLKKEVGWYFHDLGIDVDSIPNSLPVAFGIDRDERINMDGKTSYTYFVWHRHHCFIDIDLPEDDDVVGFHGLDNIINAINSWEKTITATMTAYHSSASDLCSEKECHIKPDRELFWTGKSCDVIDKWKKSGKMLNEKLEDRKKEGFFSQVLSAFPALKSLRQEAVVNPQTTRDAIKRAMNFVVNDRAASLRESQSPVVKELFGNHAETSHHCRKRKNLSDNQVFRICDSATLQKVLTDDEFANHKAAMSSTTTH